MTDPLDPIRENEALWDAWTGVHEASAFYDIEGFRRGGIRLRDEEVAAVGDVRGTTLLHLQCHFGIDTLSWARLGARVTGVDFSQRAVDLAQRLAADIRRWAEVVARFTAAGGRFFITEIHPVAQAFENEGVGPGELRLAYP
jgi:hypothetical protein